MKGLTSKEHLCIRVLSAVIIINAVIFYALSRNLQSFTANLFEDAALMTALTVFVEFLQLEYWWRYSRRRDNLRFWKPQKPLTEG